MKIWMVFLLGLCFLLHIMIPIPGFDFKTFFFFSIGAYFAIEAKNIAEYARRFNYFYIPAAIILLIACTMLQDKYLMGIYIICGVFASFALCSFLIEKYKIKPIAVLVNSCFFVYAFHPIRIFILETPRTVCRKVLERFIIGNSTYIQLSISYLLTPFLTAAMCVGIYYLLKRFAPKLTAVLTGNR